MRPHPLGDESRRINDSESERPSHSSPRENNVFEYQLHTIRQAEMLRRAEGERLARDARAARRAARRAALRHVPEGRANSPEGRSGGGRIRFTRAA
ncbi:hypothetical protein [Streptomyces sp. NPDC096153]|uniref:hypothetical protein n=1 Tax=Streptomyces sp. NPDC096153 TaxID=3155548 RepID=UPI00333079B3